MQDNIFSEQLKKLGYAIKIARKANNLTQIQLAKLAEIDRSYLQKIERGRNVTMVIIFRISFVLGLENEELYDIAFNKEKREEFIKKHDNIRGFM